MQVSPQRKALGLYLFVCSIILCVAGVALSAYIAPYVVAHNFFMAALDKNGDALSVMIDFPELRDNLRPQVRGIVRDHSAEFGDSAGWAAAFAGFFVDPAVDAFVTPSGLKLGLEKLSATRGHRYDKHWALEKLSSALPKLNSSSKRSLASDWSTLTDIAGYQSLNEFQVVANVSHETPLKLTFTRDGLFNWKLSNVALSEFVSELYKQRLAERRRQQSF